MAETVVISNDNSMGMEGTYKEIFNIFFRGHLRKSRRKRNYHQVVDAVFIQQLYLLFNGIDQLYCRLTRHYFTGMGMKGHNDRFTADKQSFLLQLVHYLPVPKMNAVE